MGLLELLKVNKDRKENILGYFIILCRIMVDGKKSKKYREMKWIEVKNDRLLKENEKKWEEEERMIVIDRWL